MTVHTGRHFLQIPGPTNVPDRVLRAMDMPTMDHRGPEFAEIGHAVLGAMQRVFRTKQPVIIYPSSGTGATPATSADASRALAPPRFGAAAQVLNERPRFGAVAQVATWATAPELGRVFGTWARTRGRAQGEGRGGLGSDA